MQPAAEAHTPSRSSVRGGLKSKCRGPSYPADSSRSTSQNAARRSPAPKRRSWSYLMPDWPLRSMWKSLPAHSACDAVREVQPGHLLVADLRVDAVQLRALQALDERQGVADGGQQDVAARLVRLGLDGEADVVPLGGDVLAEQVEGLLHAVEGVPH